MMNRAMFQQFNNMQSQVNPAMYKAQLTNKLREMKSNKVDADAEINKGISDGKITQEQADFAYSIARNIAKNLFGYSGQD